MEHNVTNPPVLGVLDVLERNWIVTDVDVASLTFIVLVCKSVKVVLEHVDQLVRLQSLFDPRRSNFNKVLNRFKQTVFLFFGLLIHVLLVINLNSHRLVL